MLYELNLRVKLRDLQENESYMLMQQTSVLNITHWTGNRIKIKISQILRKGFIDPNHFLNI